MENKNWETDSMETRKLTQAKQLSLKLLVQMATAEAISAS